MTCASHSAPRIPHEFRSRPRRHPQRRVHSHLRRQAPEVGRQRPALRRLGDLSPEGFARRSEPHLCLADQRLVRADHSALRRRRQDLAPAGHAGRRADDDARRHAQGREQQVRLRHVARNRQAAHHAPVVRRHAASVGVQARLASGAVAHRSRHGLRRRRRRRHLPLDRRRQDLARTGRPARPRHRPAVAARRRRHGPAHDPARSDESQAHVHRHLGRRRVPHRRRRQDLEADQPRPAARSTSPTRTPRSATASTASRCTRRGRTCCSCRSTGT